MSLKKFLITVLPLIYLGCDLTDDYKYLSGSYSSGEKINLSSGILTKERANSIKEFFNLDFMPSADDSFYAEVVEADVDLETQSPIIKRVKWQKASKSCIYSLKSENNITIVNKNSIIAEKNMPSLYTIYVNKDGETTLINCALNNNYKNGNNDYNDMQLWSIEADGTILSNSFSDYDNENRWIDESDIIKKSNFPFNW